MTDRNLAKPERTKGIEAQSPNPAPKPPMPSDEDGSTPTTDREPIDSPQPNTSAKREAPSPGEIGLSTKR